ncbi:winged helix-turn-helix transcriptional regulator [Martelella lutilitoris]|uniref:Winged helix-turn-helix transcriptional regulator n=1 Tax=Martelella lutilitoris TaxID=2583532 RepID=A0A5C4JT80_9HYPH|nr:MarR family winged helix-turn-helix transcriptional regulator [Martelella lutilitoris]TNB48527.1 winged helix-turn-helix transcriptional regulator [Martelella lutilitoris]
MENSDKPTLPFQSKAEWPFYWITRVSARYTFEMDRLLKQQGLDVSRWRVLSSLREHGNLSVSEIAEFCILKLNTTTKIVQRMAAEGLVKTRVSPSDARVTEVSLTEAGAEAGLKAAKTASRVFERTFTDISEEDLRRVNQVLEEIFERLA